jgi:uracil-DNA glycosylase
MPRQHDYPTAAPFVPPEADLDGLAGAARDCHGCDLYEHATQTVFGQGAADADVVLIGEQPGDAEDRQGKPFVGPAGKLLDRALADAGIARGNAYITNAVKHFRWKLPPGGRKRRIHQKPEAWQVAACRPWLDAELARLEPRVLVVLGATAGQALFGPSFRVTKERGAVVPWQAPGGAGFSVVPTVHPSSVIRTDEPEREAAYQDLVADLRVAARALSGPGEPRSGHAGTGRRLSGPRRRGYPGARGNSRVTPHAARRGRAPVRGWRRDGRWEATCGPGCRWGGTQVKPCRELPGVPQAVV